jgi:hypothetical protein
MKNIRLIVKNQFFAYFLCLGLAPLPLFLLYRFSDLPMEHMHYLFLTFLLALKVIFFKDKEYKLHLNNTLKPQFCDFYGRQPSNKELVQLKEINIIYRGSAIYLAGILVIILFVLKDLIRY